MTALRKYAGMSDDQLAHEREAMRELAEAVGNLKWAIANVNLSSSVVQIRAGAFENFVHDELPTEKFWQDRIAEARAK